ncbi:MAG: hypothetical protein PHP21_03750 [Patescibacteria group bacterium]|nr:hypothetical protein [Patescibacteria group bacterium]MDD5554965.1 hypothetical protein [Patescibacteria group bacterium]
MPSGLCTRCSFDLLNAFRKIPETVTKNIHNIQNREGNPVCFNKGLKIRCIQKNCEWQEICDVEVRTEAEKKVV